MLEAIGDGEVSDVFYVFVAELAGDAHTEGTTEANREIVAIHSIGHKSLRMEGVGHIDTVPPIGLTGEVDDVSSLWEDAYSIEDMGEWNADPLSDV